MAWFKQTSERAEKWAQRLANADKIELAQPTDPGVAHMQDMMSRVDRTYRQKLREKMALDHKLEELDKDMAHVFEEYTRIKAEVESDLKVIKSEMDKLRQQVIEFAAHFDLKAELVDRPQTGRVDPPSEDYKDGD